MKAVSRRKPVKAQRGAAAAAARAESQAASTGSRVVAFPAGGAIPDEISSADAKDRISDVVKKAAAGGRTTIMSRGYAIAVIGPVADVPEAARAGATRLPTTEIKSGQTSLKGVIARSDFAMLTIHGEARAAVYRAKVGREPSVVDGKLDRLIGLLESTGALQAFRESVQAEIDSALALLDSIDRPRAARLRADYAALRKS